MVINIPDKIKAIIGSEIYALDAVGKSNSQVLCFEQLVLKIQEQCEEADNEHLMTAWLSDKLPVPVILHSETSNAVNYLLMSRLPGVMSCTEELLETPGHLVTLLARGLRMLWKVRVSGCPGDHSIDNKLKAAENRVRNNLCDMEDVEPETYGPGGFKNPADLLAWLQKNKPAEELVFSHGDYCLPNIFIKDDGISGFIDLGRSGIADRYQDIALCYRSLRDNLSGRYARKSNSFDAAQLFDELEIVPDWKKVKYYMLLDELF